MPVQQSKRSLQTTNPVDFRNGFLLGVIILIETSTANVRYNPFGLPLGTEFHELLVQPLPDSCVATDRVGGAKDTL